MKIVFNDLSLPERGKANNVGKGLDEMLQLASTLRNIGVEKIIVPSDFYTKEFYGFQINRIFGFGHNFQRRGNEVLALLDFLERMDADYDNEFSLTETFSETSRAMALAALTCLPSISFSYYAQFNNNEIKGFTGDETNHQENEVKPNLYKRNTGNYTLLSKFLMPTKTQPLEKPLWNSKSSRDYLQKVHYFDYIKGKDKNEQRKMLITHGRIIAEMNGWTYSAALSKRNSSNEKKRIVFISLGFKYQHAYLCIDLRHPDLHFELCDKQGIHTGEYSWDGKKLHGHQEGHNIKV